MSEENKKELTSKEKDFCYNYVVHPTTRWNGTQSAILAGYSESSAYMIASENLRKPHIVIEIDKLVDESRQSHKALEEMIIIERKKLAFSDIADFVDYNGDLRPFSEIDTPAIKKITKETIKANGVVVSTDYKIELHDKTKNLDSLASYLGIDKKTVDLNVTDINVIYLDHQDKKL